MRLESGRYCTPPTIIAAPPTIIAAPPTIIAAPPEFGGAWASRQRRVIAEIIMIGYFQRLNSLNGRLRALTRRQLGLQMGGVYR